MNPTEKPSLKSLKNRRRRVQLSAADLVRETPLFDSQSLPLSIEPVAAELRLTIWAQQNRDRLLSRLHTYGGVLLRGFQVRDAEDFGAFVAAISTEPMTYSYRSTPRSQVHGKVYTSTEYPADRTIPLHNEMAYARQWPMMLAFHCQQPATEQGETPIADSHRVLAQIPEVIRQEFANRGICYVRNYGDGLDLPWQEVFQTQSRQQVETICHDAQIDFEWWGDDRLRTRQVCQAIATHPHTGKAVWFNQSHLFHISNAGAAQEYLKANFDPICWPRNAYFGDGGEISEEILEAIRAAFAAETVVFPWQAGDVLLLDNMAVAHGRRPFSGPRRVLAGMADPYSAAGGVPDAVAEDVPKLQQEVS
ncbi:putative taurine catabolism dioxygenase [Rubidibacter lacunae KORDI 51-2]|uniref:Putative taurine catabolism dioxygenase n=1 Tax=Rubidibacter lacunae KORDI 51-2 TaxID=582515 RepID=U5DC46_9CHRO|nr:TauD/TfdA family dioxygenase [Rubidibacter lacunae]ERN42083.1 putative taurine catabolism dioxygenase [Rubidibacter lacunae KORDI 51-2]